MENLKSQMRTLFEDLQQAQSKLDEAEGMKKNLQDRLGPETLTRTQVLRIHTPPFISIKLFIQETSNSPSLGHIFIIASCSTQQKLYCFQFVHLSLLWTQFKTLTELQIWDNIQSDQRNHGNHTQMGYLISCTMGGHSEELCRVMMMQDMI